MDPTNREEGPRNNITRRDFLDGVAVFIGGVIAAKAAGAAEAVLPEDGPAASGSAPAMPAGSKPGAYYPPRLQGMRGFEDAAMNAGHSVRDRTAPVEATDTGERYDLVVVGSGMSGLSAAYFYRKQFPDAKVLILEGCDDFGGHARRVEFEVDGRQLLIPGGTEALWNPNTFSPESLRMLEDIGIDRGRYAKHTKNDPETLVDAGLKPGLFFGKEAFGVDCLLNTRPVFGGPNAASPEELRDYFGKSPMSGGMIEGMIKLMTDRTDYMAGLSREEKISRLRKMSYIDYLRDVAKIGPETLAYVQKTGSGDTTSMAAGPETFSAFFAWRRGSRGFLGLGPRPPADPSNLTRDTGAHIHFPDGNAGVARLLVRWLVPDALPGETAEDSIATYLRYDRLDSPENNVRLRLSSMVTNVRHVGDPDSAREVEVSYVRDGRARTVRADAAVLACFNAIIPYIAPELPEVQKDGLRLAVRKPLVRAFVAIRNWKAFEKLGVSSLQCIGTYFTAIEPWIMPEWGGAYRNARKPDEPVILYMRMTNELLELHGSGLPPREQWRAARARLQTIPFEEMESKIRDQLDRALGPGGFDSSRDIAGITICRWSHGYAGGTNELFDPDWTNRPDAPWVVGRRRFGRIAIANSDSAATALTNAAFAQSHRAVTEIINDIVRPVYDYHWSERDTAGLPDEV